VTIVLNKVYQGDCVSQLAKVPAGSVDLVFADPPFNIGYEYDEYDDRRPRNEYHTWSRSWMAGVARVLKPDGTFWLAIGDEHAAELKVIAQDDLGFSCRSWVIWYYTFGVNCRRGFSRSHTHLFHFVKDAARFTFNAENPLVRVLSARQMVYADNRANPRGRLPDNTWILRPQDAPRSCFAPMHDTWYFARVAGTFKEREGFHGCQMPEQLLGRIIRVSSHPGDVVLDPFTGSGTTLVTAKKLGRRWLGFELSPEYARRAAARIEQTRVGEPLDGPEDPLQSAPSTAQGKSKLRLRNGLPLPSADPSTEQVIIQAFRAASQGNSADYLLCDRELNEEFIRACQQAQAPGGPYAWNRLLLRIRKSGKLPKTGRSPRQLSFEAMDPYICGSEIAMQLLGVDYDMNIDDILCHPAIADEFDRVAAAFTPGYRSFEYRWAALTIRKRATKSRSLAREQFGPWLTKRLPRGKPLSHFTTDAFARPAVYVLAAAHQPLYVGETINLRDRIVAVLGSESWSNLGADSLTLIPTEDRRSQHGLQAALVQRLKPLLNSQLLVPGALTVARGES
jgi:DNA modification methylase